MKSVFLFFFVFLTTLCGHGQTFSISQMNNPDPNLDDLGSVLLVGNRALSGSGTSQLYYDGSNWTMISSQAGGGISGIDKGGGEIYAIYSSTALYSWNDSTNSWGLASNYPTGSFSAFRPFVLSENNVYFVTRDTENYGWIYRWDGTSFTALSSEYWYTYCAIYVKDQNNIFVATYKNTNYDPMFIRYNSITKSNTILFTFPGSRGNPNVIRSKDNNVFFILMGCGDLYRWTNNQAKMDLIYESSTNDYYQFGRDMIIIDNNNVVTCGGGGIRHITVPTSSVNVVYPTSNTFNVWSGSYNGQGRGMFVGDNGLILDMQVIGSVPDESINSALKIYPNPASTSFTLEFPVFGVNEKTVELYSSTGQLVKREHFQSFKTTLDISALPSGMYLVNVLDKTGKILASKKLLVR